MHPQYDPMWILGQGFEGLHRQLGQGVNSLGSLASELVVPFLFASAVTLAVAAFTNPNRESRP